MKYGVDTNSECMTEYKTYFSLPLYSVNQIFNGMFGLYEKARSNVPYQDKNPKDRQNDSLNEQEPEERNDICA